MPRRILIVEDDSSIAKTLMLMLQTLPDVEVLRAYDGEEAIGLWAKRPADIVLTDNHMRGMSGLELVRALRLQGARQPILMITAYDSVQLQRDARAAGVTELIAKPFFFDQLLDRIASLLPQVAMVAR